ncbi:YciI family protein [Bradyrhizobium sp. NP1]|uniref:YciI family protein n=1 Tax=Bradyrhizobium sp. NP1 TaxID=3049772 RepID=UPI0025A55696|nr:YciI family protein [Bradyrhizobium sp. NP1]WJR75517.1 YciI family protein [Bradyrhizobium sp. NP1]
MSFLIQCRYRTGAAEERFSIRAKHLEHMIAALPTTVAGGALLDQRGSAIGMFVVLEAEDRASAEGFISGEPYNAAGLFETVEIYGLKLMTPEPEPNFLEAELVRQRHADRKAKGDGDFVTE